MSVRAGEFTYAMKTRFDGGRQRTDATLTCHTCPATISRSMTGVHNPELVLKAFRRDGWLADAVTHRLCRCPDCQRKKKENGHMVATPTPIMGVKMTDAPTVPRDLTRAEKDRVLDQFEDLYDRKKGSYLEGWTDKKLGEHLDLPWASVAAFREMTYGPLKIDSECQAIRDLIAQEQTRITEIAADLQKQLMGARSNLDQLSRDLGQIEAKRLRA